MNKFPKGNIFPIDARGFLPTLLCDWCILPLPLLFSKKFPLPFIFSLRTKIIIKNTFRFIAVDSVFLTIVNLVGIAGRDFCGFDHNDENICGLLMTWYFITVNIEIRIISKSFLINVFSITGSNLIAYNSVAVLLSGGVTRNLKFYFYELWVQIFQVEVFWIATPCNYVVGQQRFWRPCCLHIYPQDGESQDLRNVGILPQNYTVSQPRRPRLETSPPWKIRNLFEPGV
jgi:hypothetical protein